ncbi:unnamed protein product [Durusdinium trenchii]|uniref:Uncharacterized protein n=1 Tax=Durusdinium trenchii TaxID=1381693 RepID=A0ABP0HBV0_9DINO
MAVMAMEKWVRRWKLLLHFLLLLASSGPAATPNLMERCQVILNLHKGHSALVALTKESLPTPALLQQATMNFDLMNLTESNHLPRSVLKHRAFCPSVELQEPFVCLATQLVEIGQFLPH